MIKKFSFLICLLFLLSACSNENSDSNQDAKETLETLLPIVIDQIKQDYVTNVSDKKLIEGALNGMLGTLDPYSMYLNQKDFEKLNEFAKGEFTGIGVQVIVTKGAIKVIASIDDTPAYKAGLKPGDAITRINGHEVHKLSFNEIAEQLHGEPGSEISLTVARTDSESFAVKLVRSVIKVNPVKFYIKDDVGYIRISCFNEFASAKLKDALKELSAHKEIQGLILDLRNNPGGTLEQGIEVASQFLDSGIIVEIKSRNSSNNQTIHSKGSDLAKGIPMVVLINKGSASSSEIVAGALKDHKRAIIMGVPSFGKGSVQTVFSIPGHGGIRLTTASFFTPKGNEIQNKGIEPDILVEEAVGEKEDVMKKIEVPLILEKSDYQLQRAIDLIKGLSLFQIKTSHE
ncbi:MAG: S41 family peptidase [Alphaproteobacteria bacterium]|nr:S41 family peptidase [Alphaproteobacteria bacterium]